jgi:fluoroquinolone transport system permease protein
MTRLLKQISWQFLIFQRNNLVTMIVAITAFYVLIIYFVRELPNVDRFVLLLIYNDPAIVGFIFMGIAIILEKDQDVLPALFATPLDHHVYLISRIVTLSTLGTLGALAMMFAAHGTRFNLVHFSVGAFFTCVLFTLLGIVVVSYTQEVLHFMLRAIPVLIGMSLPLLNYFELTDSTILRLFPIQGGLNLIVNSYREPVYVFELIYGYVSIAAWTTAFYWFAYRKFVSRVVRN